MCFTIPTLQGRSFSHQYQFHNLTYKQGLLSNIVPDILQDSSGIIWVATNKGLQRFDGYRFETYYNSSDSLLPELINRINQIALGNDHLLWLATDAGVVAFNSYTETYVDLQFGSSPDMDFKPLLPAQEVIKLIAIDNNQNIWIANNSVFNCYKFKYESGLLQPIDIQNFESIPGYGVPANQFSVEKIRCDAQGFVFMSTNHGVHIFNTSSSNVAYMHSIGEKQGIANPNDIVFTPTVVTFLSNAEIVQYERNALLTQSNAQPMKRYTLSSLFANKPGDVTWSKEGFMYREKHLFIATVSELVEIDFVDNRKPIVFFQKLPNEVPFTRENNINGLTIDSYSNIWIATQGNGIFKGQITQLPISQIKVTPENGARIYDYEVTAIQQDVAGNLWIGTDEKGVFLYNIENQEYKNYTYRTDGRGLADDEVRDIAIDSIGNIYIGVDGGLSIFNPKTQSFKNYIHIEGHPQDYAKMLVSCMTFSQSNTLWISYRSGILQVMVLANGELELVNDFNFKADIDNPFYHAEIVSLSASGKNVFFGTTLGLGRVELNEDGLVDTVLYYKEQKNRKEQFGANSVLSILPVSDTIVWLGMKGAGLRKIAVDIRSNKYKVIGYAGQEFVLHDDVNALAIDQKGDLWISGDKGLSRLNTTAGKVMNITTEDGLINNRHISQFTNNKGQLFLGGERGIDYFYPNEIKQSDKRPSPNITNLTINGQNLMDMLNPNDKSGMLPLTKLQHIALSPNQNNITFEFSAFYYTFSERIRYRYMLDGVDKEWTEVGADKRTVTYKNLNPGKKVFKVYCTNHDGIWFEDEMRQLELFIAQPLYKRVWFILFVLMTGIALALALYFHRTRKIKIGTQLLELLIEERTAELESFTYSVSHDLKSPLRAISGYSNILLEEHNSGLSDDAISLVHKIIRNTQKLSLLIEELLHFSRISRKEVQKQPINMKELCKQVFSDLEDTYDTSKVNFKLDDIPDAIGDKAMVQQVLQNLLSNAVKFSSNVERPTVHVTGYRQQKKFVYVVQDNGEGFDEKYAPKVFEVFQRLHSEKQFPGTGVGLAIAKRIIKKHDGDIWCKSQPDKGAAFFFYL